MPALVIETASCQTISSTGAKAVSHSQLPKIFQGIYTLQYDILFLFSERLLHIQTCSRTNLQPATTTDSKAVLRPKFVLAVGFAVGSVFHSFRGWALPCWCLIQDWAGLTTQNRRLGEEAEQGLCCQVHAAIHWPIPRSQMWTSTQPQCSGRMVMRLLSVMARVPQETKRSLLNCVKTFWRQWWHLPKRWNRTPNRPHYPFCTHRPLILQAVVWHDDAISILWKGN